MAQGKSQSAKAAAVEARRLARAARKAADKAAAMAKVAADSAAAANQAAKEAAVAALKAGALTSPGACDDGTERWFPLEFKDEKWQVRVGSKFLTLDQLRDSGKNVRVTLTLGSPPDDQDRAKLQQQQQLLEFVSAQFATVLLQEGTCDNQS